MMKSALVVQDGVDVINPQFPNKLNLKVISTPGVLVQHEFFRLVLLFAFAVNRWVKAEASLLRLKQLWCMTAL